MFANGGRRMKPRSLVLCSIFIVLLSMIFLFLQQPPSAAATRTVRVGVFPAAPLVQNTGNRPEGLFIDLIEYFAGSLDWRIEYVDKPWGELLVDLEEGEIDLLPAVAVTNERRSIYDYSKNPPFIDSGVLFTGSNFHLNTIFDLQGARVAGVEGSIFTRAFESCAASFGVECDILLKPDNPSVMQAIADGTADAGISIYSLGIELSRKYPVSITAISFSPTALSFAAPKGKNSDLIAGIDRLMAPMVKDPNSLYGRSFDKWIMPNPPASIPIWIWWAIGGLFLLGLLLALWSTVLRRQVAAKTKHLVAEISERERAEELLRQSQKMEAVGQLAGGIAHDFNNLLSAIIGYADLVLSHDGALQPESVRSDVEEIKHAGLRGAALTKQILAFSRRQALKPEIVCLNDVLGGLESLLRRTLGEDIDLVTVLCPDLGQSEVDPHQLEQVLMNLALNARDAMPSGGRLALETANVELDEEYCRTRPDTTPGSYVMLSVSDTGTGMDAETTSHVFEPFFTTKAPDQGTGLGLSTVYGIVRQSGGNISVYSEPGKGTSFKLYLPRVARPKSAPASVARATSSTRGQETILVVEDEDAIRGLVDRILDGLGYEVLTAATADEALKVLADGRSPVDLLLTDVVLPGSIQGNDLACSLLAIWPDLPVLYMSGYTRNATVHTGRLDAGVNFLEKPFTPDALGAKVRAVLDRALG
jgi:signal transduction histidine kinase/ActR/RegA family two-component response regulator